MLTYRQYSTFYASKCDACKGVKRLLKNGVWTACSCQYTASAKWRIDQFEVVPPDLKYKTWNDFTGVHGDSKLTNQSFIQAKQKALRYCFGGEDVSLINDRQKNLIVHEHLNDGQNVVIAGATGSGRTLLAVLI